MRDTQKLPGLVRRWLGRALVHEDQHPREVRVTQEGEMWLKAGGRGLRFDAVELFAVERERVPRAPECTWIKIRKMDSL